MIKNFLGKTKKMILVAVLCLFLPACTSTYTFDTPKGQAKVTTKQNHQVMHGNEAVEIKAENQAGETVFQQTIDPEVDLDPGEVLLQEVVELVSWALWTNFDYKGEVRMLGYSDTYGPEPARKTSELVAKEEDVVKDAAAGAVDLATDVSQNKAQETATHEAKWQP